MACREQSTMAAVEIAGGLRGNTSATILKGDKRNRFPWYLSRLGGFRMKTLVSLMTLSTRNILERSLMREGGREW